MSNYLTYDLDCSVLGFLGLWSGRTAGSTTIARSDLKIDLKVYSKYAYPLPNHRIIRIYIIILIILWPKPTGYTWYTVLK